MCCRVRPGIRASFALPQDGARGGRFLKFFFLLAPHPFSFEKIRRVSAPAKGVLSFREKDFFGEPQKYKYEITGLGEYHI